LRVLHAYPTIARRRGGRSLRLFRRRSTYRRRQNVSKRAGARLDQRHASVGQSPVRATGPERAALRSSGVVFTRRRSRTVGRHAAAPEAARRHPPHQTSSRRYGCHDTPGCAALRGRRDGEIESRSAGPAVGDAPIARKERWPLRQHRQHRLQPTLGTCRGGREPGRQALVATGICRTSRLLF
jgi:hypothetical protein